MDGRRGVLDLLRSLECAGHRGSVNPRVGKQAKSVVHVTAPPLSPTLLLHQRLQVDLQTTCRVANIKSAQNLRMEDAKGADPHPLAPFGAGEQNLGRPAGEVRAGVGILAISAIQLADGVAPPAGEVA